jgi:phosphatidate cytidylyltransferase
MESGTIQRVITAAILIPIVIAAIWWGPGWLVAILTAVVTIAGLVEFFALGAQIGLHAYRLWTYVAAAGIIAEQWYVSRPPSTNPFVKLLDRLPKLNLELVLFSFVLGAAVIAIGSRSQITNTLSSISVSSAGLLFIALPLSTVIRLHAVDDIGPQLLLFAVVLVWAGDTAAYFVGRAFGRWKLAPHLSPGKTWEGAAANLLGALSTASIFGHWMKIPAIHLLLMASAGSIAGQIGDLFESAWKRSAGAKDSGTLLPGHGGMLDRIDALILAAPAVWYYFEWLVLKKN